jgi:hypothetical protein
MNTLNKKNIVLEKNVPTDPSKWQYYVSQAKKKFDVYPSAYANGWASKQYKAAGGGWKTEEGQEPQHVAQGLPQTKEKKQPMIGERFIKYLEDIGLKHAAYTNEAGDVKVIGLNKAQIKDAINNMVVKSEIKNFVESGLEESEEGDRIQKINDRIKALKQKLSATKSDEQKKLFQDRLKNALQTLSNIKKGHGIKAPHSEIALPAAGTGLTFPGGTINGSPTEDDVKNTRKQLDKEALTSPDTEPDVITALKDIVKNHQSQKIRDGKNGKTVTVDVQSANAVVHIYNGLGTSNRIKYVNGGLISMVNMAWKILAR